MNSGNNNKATLLMCARRAAKILAEQTTSPSARADICLGLIKKKKADERLASFQERLRALPIEERHYWIGTLYTLMLPGKVRRSQRHSPRGSSHNQLKIQGRVHRTLTINR